MMIGSGMPSTQSSAPLPKPMMASFVDPQANARDQGRVPLAPDRELVVLRALDTAWSRMDRRVMTGASYSAPRIPRHAVRLQRFLEHAPLNARHAKLEDVRDCGRYPHSPWAACHKDRI